MDCRSSPANDAGRISAARNIVGHRSMNISRSRKQTPLFDAGIVLPAVASAFTKLDPRSLVSNPVMFVLELVSALTTVILLRDLVIGADHISFELQIVLWLWFTLLFANFSEAI